MKRRPADKSAAAALVFAAATMANVARRSLLLPLPLFALFSGCTQPKAPDVFRVLFDTTKGPFVIEAHRAWSPLGTDRFYDLVQQRFFDGDRFFRVLPNFVVQFGINGDPVVTRKWEAAKIDDDPVQQSNLRGYLSFATGGPLTRTTQIFINVADNARLDKVGFSPFGRVVSGMDVVGRLYSEYGEGAPRGKGPDQKRIEGEGNSYLEKEFPKLDYIKTARVA
ncbi:MAG: peptidylprolyl isomerase [Acidobacteriota bacterium]|nr:peptidylprolyl isomerase [Acidobacteriota bacterium]